MLIDGRPSEIRSAPVCRTRIRVGVTGGCPLLVDELAALVRQLEREGSKLLRRIRYQSQATGTRLTGSLRAPPPSDVLDVNLRLCIQHLFQCNRPPQPLFRRTRLVL